MRAALVVPCFKRADHLRRCLASLAACEQASETHLTLVCDGGDEPTVAEVRQISHNVDGFASVNVIEQTEHLGLARNVIGGVNAVAQQHPRIAVVEDDLQVSPFVLKYLNSALDYYEGRGIGCVAAYSPNLTMPADYPYSTYVMRRNCSWGWATYADVWNSVDWQVSDYAHFKADPHQRASFNECGNDLSAMLARWHRGELDSWSIRFCYSLWRRGLATVYPRRSLVRNNGADGSGSNVPATKRYDTALAQAISLDAFVPGVAPEPQLLEQFRAIYNTSPLRALRNRLTLYR